MSLRLKRSAPLRIAVLVAFTVSLALSASAATASSEPAIHGPGIQIKVRPGPVNEVAGFGSVWVLSQTKTTEVSRIDPATNEVTGVVHLGLGAVGGDAGLLEGSITAGFNSVWVSDYNRNRVDRIDPATLRVVAHIHTGVSPADVLAAFGAVFVANINDNSMQRIDPVTDKVVDTISIGKPGVYGDGPLRLSSDGTDIWATEPGEDSVVEVDPTTNSVIDTELVAPAYACGKAYPVPGGLWLNDTNCSFTESRYDLSSHSVVASFTTTDCLYGFAVYRAHVYTAEDVYHPRSTNCHSGSLYKRDLMTGDVISSEHIGSDTVGLVGLGGSLWTNNWFFTSHAIRVPLF